MATMTLEAPITLDLGVLIGNRPDVRTLSGHDRGVEARALLKLDELDEDNRHVSVVVPESVVAISPSFLQGMLTRSIRKLGRAQFERHYNFQSNRYIREQLGEVVADIAGQSA